MKDYKDYKRQPIILSNHSIALIKIYERYDNLEDIWTSDLDDMLRHLKKDENHWEVAAKQFIQQLEGQVSRRFLKALKKEIETELENFDNDMKKEMENDDSGN